MGRVWTGWVWAAALVVGSAGCQNKLYDENKKLYDENRELRAQNDDIKNRQQTGARPPIEQTTYVPQQPQQNFAPRIDTQPAPSNPAPSGPERTEQIGGLETTVNREAGTTTVHLPSDVFFDPGQATLKSSAKTSLDKVVSALKNKFVTKKVIVEGHTDKKPIKYSKWESNQQLSEARAKAVKDYLVAHGIEAGRLSTKGLGDTKPRGADDAKNRRVEIVVLSGR